jgi:hypothetical protein
MIENADSFTLLLLISGVILFQLYYLVTTVLAKRIFVGSVTIICVTLFLMQVWLYLPSMLGYPYKSNKLPDKFQLIDYIDLPREGKLLVWLKEENVKRPRVYEIKMNNALKKNMRKAKKGGAHKYDFVKKNKTKRSALEQEDYDLRLKLKPVGIKDFKANVDIWDIPDTLFPPGSPELVLVPPSPLLEDDFDPNLLPEPAAGPQVVLLELPARPVVRHGGGALASPN